MWLDIIDLGSGIAGGAKVSGAFCVGRRLALAGAKSDELSTAGALSSAATRIVADS